MIKRVSQIKVEMVQSKGMDDEEQKYYCGLVEGAVKHLVNPDCFPYVAADGIVIRKLNGEEVVVLDLENRHLKTAYERLKGDEGLMCFPIPDYNNHGGIVLKR